MYTMCKYIDDKQYEYIIYRTKILEDRRKKVKKNKRMFNDGKSDVKEKKTTKKSHHYL